MIVDYTFKYQGFFSYTVVDITNYIIHRIFNANL